ncbi:hypothetical protein [uncultured Bacteroides sp.]|uniref:hypothetical protein n=1 Tax=uncultured Bacteroides sp. TaxID=162156 RepID=UPI00260A290F|nr:hypothetical protein [uncultured Bacteroides sp.]
MQKTRYIILLLIAFLVGLSACHYHVATSLGGTVSSDSDSVAVIPARAYELNSNFEVAADTLWLHLLPFRDTIPVVRGDQVVVAEFDVHPQDSVDSIWVKVARDQETIGWIQEKKLLKHIIPVDPISQCIHLFSNSHALPFFLILGVFFLSFLYRAIRRKQIKLIWLNDIDSVFPIVLTWLMTVAATLYNSIQHFVPETWEHYYYNPSLNPFDVPFILGLFVVCVALILLVGVAMLDDLFHQAKIGIAFFYLIGLASCCIFLYIFFTYIWVYIAYICLAAYSYCCFRWLRRADRYPFACGACGAKMRRKGICPHCGAMNE